MIGNLFKAAVSVALTPVALAVDLVTLPASADDLRRSPFDRAGKLLNAAGDNINKEV